MIAPIPEVEAAQRACPLAAGNPCKGRECAWWRFVEAAPLQGGAQFTFEPSDGAEFPAENVGVCLGVPSTVNQILVPGGREVPPVGVFKT